MTRPRDLSRMAVGVPLVCAALGLLAIGACALLACARVALWLCPGPEPARGYPDERER